MNPLTPFHLAIAVADLAQAKEFYGSVLGCPQGRSADRWVDFNLFGHQLVCHLVDQQATSLTPDQTNAVDGDAVPVPHFGVVLEWSDWKALADRLCAANVPFLIEPKVRFSGQAGEQAILFIQDPSHNALEFKSFKNIETQLFSR